MLKTDVLGCIRGYRGFQMLEMYMNAGQQKVFVTSLFGAGIPVIALCASMSIKTSRYSGDSIVPVICFTLGISTTALLVLIYNSMAGLHVKSQIFFDSMAEYVSE